MKHIISKSVLPTLLKPLLNSKLNTAGASLVRLFRTVSENCIVLSGSWEVIHSHTTFVRCSLTLYLLTTQLLEIFRQIVRVQIFTLDFYRQEVMWWYITFSFLFFVSPTSSDDWEQIVVIALCNMFVFHKIDILILLILFKVCFWNNEILTPIQKNGMRGPGQDAFKKLKILLDRMMLRRTKVWQFALRTLEFIYVYIRSCKGQTIWDCRLVPLSSGEIISALKRKNSISHCSQTPSGSSILIWIRGQYSIVSFLSLGYPIVNRYAPSDYSNIFSL